MMFFFTVSTVRAAGEEVSANPPAAAASTAVTATAVESLAAEIKKSTDNFLALKTQFETERNSLTAAALSKQQQQKEADALKDEGKDLI